MKRIVQLAATLLLGLGLMWLASGFSPRGVLYDSVHSVGQRFGSVLPAGLDSSGFLPSDQYVRAGVPIGLSHPDRPSASQRSRILEQQREQDARVLRARLLLWGALSGCVLFVLAALAWTSRGASGGGGSGFLMRAGVAVLMVGVLCVFGFTQARAFWVGVDDALIERSSQINAGTGTVQVLADSTLDLSMVAYWAMLIAAVLTALPLMVLAAGLAVRSARGDGRTGARTRGSGMVRGVCAHYAGMRMRWVWATGQLAVLVYGLLVLGLWSAPWSITMARALLRL